jgi:hypothetical protein
LFCPAFWQNVQPDWSDTLREVVIEGVVSDNPQLVMNGNAYMLSVFVINGSTSRVNLVISPLRLSIYPKVFSFKKGDTVRIVGLRWRPGNSVSSTIRTVVMSLEEIPHVLLATT